MVAARRWAMNVSACHAAGITTAQVSSARRTNEPRDACTSLMLLSAPASPRGGYFVRKPSVTVTLTFGYMLDCFHHEMCVCFQRNDQCLCNWWSYETQIKEKWSLKNTACLEVGLGRPPSWVLPQWGGGGGVPADGLHPSREKHWTPYETHTFWISKMLTPFPLKFKLQLEDKIAYIGLRKYWWQNNNIKAPLLSNCQKNEAQTKYTKQTKYTTI